MTPQRACAPVSAEERARRTGHRSAVVWITGLSGVYCRCPLSVCEQRDPKGLYRRARAGLLPEFTGISSPYEEPSTPELTVDSARVSVDEEVGRLIGELERRGIVAVAS